MINDDNRREKVKPEEMLSDESRQNFEKIPKDKFSLEAFTPKREKFRDPSYLPSHKEIEDSFQGVDQGPWLVFLGGRKNQEPIREFLNQEFISSLCDYLTERLKEISGSKQGEILIMEIGAGNGRLTHFIQQELTQRNIDNVRIIATDSGKDDIEHKFPVEILDCTQAVDKYKPSIVIYSWMPYGVDLSKDIRMQPSVQEYILIGPPEVCGDSWRTWGVAESYDYWDRDNERLEDYYARVPKKSPSEFDGFEMVEVPEISETQICNLDIPGDYGQHSKTFSFRRANGSKSKESSTDKLYDLTDDGDATDYNREGARPELEGEAEFVDMHARLLGNNANEAIFERYEEFWSTLDSEGLREKFVVTIGQMDFSITPLFDRLLREEPNLREATAGKNIIQIVEYFHEKIEDFLEPFAVTLGSHLIESGIENEKAADVAADFLLLEVDSIRLLIVSDPRIHESRVGSMEKLERIEWPSGDALKFEPVATIDMDDGGQRIFYNATLSYREKTSNEEKTVDLTHFITDQTIYFEGIRGSVVTAGLESDELRAIAGAVNHELGEVFRQKIVALNVDGLIIETKAVSTIFHEIGHIYLRQFEPELLPVQQRAIARILKRTRKEQLPRGMKIYQDEAKATARDVVVSRWDTRMAFDAEIRRIKKESYWVPLKDAHLDSETVAKIISLGLLSNDFKVPIITPERLEILRQSMQFMDDLDELDKTMKDIERGKNVKAEDRYRLIKQFPDIARIAKIFQERYARAFAVRQIKRLDMANVNERDVFEIEMRSLEDQAKLDNDTRYNNITDSARFRGRIWNHNNM